MPIFYPTFAGGPLRFMRYQPGLRKRDIHARVLAGTARSKDDFHPHEGPLQWADAKVGSMLPIEHQEGMPVHRVRLPAQTGIVRTSSYFRALIHLCEDPRTRPDVIQLHSFERLESLYWLWRLKALGIPLVYAIQIARPNSIRPYFLRLARNRARRLFYDQFDAIVTNSDEIAEGLKGLDVGAPISVIPNGVDLGRYHSCKNDGDRIQVRQAIGLHGNGPVLLSVGAISPRKGSDLLVEAWVNLLRKIPDLELVLVGPRHDQNNPKLVHFGKNLQRLINDSSRPKQVHLLGVQNDMNRFYASADLVVLPSSQEGMPNVVLEAMACERPVLLTPFLGQSPSIGRPGIEFEETRRSVDALAMSIDKLLSDTERRKALSRSGKAWVRKYLDIEQSLDQFADFYRHVAEGTVGEAPRSQFAPEEPSPHLSRLRSI